MSVEERLVVGVDFGTLSGRAVVVRVRDGAELGAATHAYAHGVLDRQLPDGTPLGSEWALQVPDDYREVLRVAVPAALADAGADPAEVIAIGTDVTSCTLVPTTEAGVPLCELPGYATEPHAYAKLWKHHAAQPQADRITALAVARSEPWLARYGGLVSSEWQLPKILQVLEEAPAVYAATARFVEAADWIVWQLTGELVANASSLGYKGLHQDGAHPDRALLAALDPGLADLTDRLAPEVGRLGAPAGRLTAEAAGWTGLPEGIVVAVGNIDAHATVPVARATRPGRLVMIMGTSTCHVVTSETLHEVPGMCGAVAGGVVEGLWGYEAGQSGVGDILDWFVRTAVPESYAVTARERGLDLHELLSELAAAQPVGAHGLVALDWHSGNRSVLVDHALSGVLVGATLATRPEEVYRALVEATAFGSRTIVETFRAAGVPVTDVVAAGGLVRNAFLMQVYADVLGLPLGVVRSTQAAALGAAAHAAVAVGCFTDVHAAADVFGAVDEARYVPDPDRAAAYGELYAEYRELHDHFGRRDGVMHRLRRLRDAARPT